MLTKVKGFTLIEVMVVVIIIACIAAFLGPSLLGGNHKSQANAKASMLDFVKTVHSDLTNLSEPYCTTRDTNADGYVSCTMSGDDRNGQRATVEAQCASGFASYGNSGCKPNSAVRPRYLN